MQRFLGYQIELNSTIYNFNLYVLPCCHYRYDILVPTELEGFVTNSTNRSVGWVHNVFWPTGAESVLI